MPKLYEYFGLTIMFYANEHEPVHVHGKFSGHGVSRGNHRAEWPGHGDSLQSGCGPVAAGAHEMRYFEEIVTARADDIIAKWIDFFVLHKPIAPERITRRLK